MLEQFQEIGKDLFAEGLIGSHSGNLSIREGDKIYITRTGAQLGRLKKEDIIECGLLEKGSLDNTASIELTLHREIYKETEAGAIVHAHGPYTIALSICENKIIPADAEGESLLRTIPVVKARENAGDQEAAEFLAKMIKENNKIAVLKGHGSFAIGRTLEEAYHYTSCLEKSSQIRSIMRILKRDRKEGIAPVSHRGPVRSEQHRNRGRSDSVLPSYTNIMQPSSKYDTRRGGGFNR